MADIDPLQMVAATRAPPAVGAVLRAFEANVRRRGSSAALIQGERTVSFVELRAQAMAFANTLVQHGFGPGERCLLWAANGPDMAAAMLGVWACGGIIALVNDDAPASHFVHAARVTQPTVAIVGAIVAVPHDIACPVLALSSGDGPGVDTGPAAEIDDQQPASILFTSGSSGLPKGVVQSHASLVAGCRMIADQIGITPDDVILCPIPWAFDYGYGQLLSTLVLGVTQVLPVARNPFAICAAIATHRPTIFAGLPSVFAQLLRGVSPVRETDLSSLRLVTNTGGKIAPTIFAEVIEVFGHCDISLNYGMTETYRSASLPVQLARSHPDSVGYACPGAAITVLRADGSEAAIGEIGEIIHRGTGVFLGYWGLPDATATVLRPDPLWLGEGVAPAMAVFSGDLGWKDADGLLYIKGRRDRQIKSMGVRVSPDEIETLIRATGLVRDVAVVGVPHEMLGEMVVAAITLPDGADDPTPALKQQARSEMSQYMQPRKWHIVEQFPLTPNGKPNYAALRVLLQDVSR